MEPILKWEKFSPRLGDWAPKIKPFFDEGGMEPIYTELKSCGKRIAPLSGATFRCFTETPLSSLKVVMMGYCPYHSTVGDVIVADGLLMSCENTLVLQPSLTKFYEGLENELHNGLCLTCYQSPSTKWLAKQGVLMFNSALTTIVGEAGAHQQLWEAFTTYIIRDVIAPLGTPIIFLGKDAGQYAGCLPEGYPSFELYHPVYAARRKEIWDTHGVFTKVNEILTKNGNGNIEWMEHRLHELDAPF